jgi:hypothetical protein
MGPAALRGQARLRGRHLWKTKRFGDGSGRRKTSRTVPRPPPCLACRLLEMVQGFETISPHRPPPACSAARRWINRPNCPQGPHPVRGSKGPPRRRRPRVLSSENVVAVGPAIASIHPIRPERPFRFFSLPGFPRDSGIPDTKRRLSVSQCSAPRRVSRFDGGGGASPRRDGPSLRYLSSSSGDT